MCRVCAGPLPRRANAHRHTPGRPQITYLDEYYLTGYEMELLRQASAELASAIPAGAMVVELGSGLVRVIVRPQPCRVVLRMNRGKKSRRGDQKKKMFPPLSLVFPPHPSSLAFPPDLSSYPPPSSLSSLTTAGSNLRKVCLLLQALEDQAKPVDYYALDLSQRELERTLAHVPDFQHVSCHGLLGTYDDGREWLKRPGVLERPKCILHIGSSIGASSSSSAYPLLTGGSQATSTATTPPTFSRAFPSSCAPSATLCSSASTRAATRTRSSAFPVLGPAGRLRCWGLTCYQT